MAKKTLEEKARKATSTKRYKRRTAKGKTTKRATKAVSKYAASVGFLA